MARTLEPGSLPSIKLYGQPLQSPQPLLGSAQHHRRAAAPAFLGTQQVTFPWGSNPLQPFLVPERRARSRTELTELGAACSRAEAWQQRASNTALLRQKNRGILAVELESRVVAMVQASWGKGSTVWAQGLVVECPQ